VLFFFKTQHRFVLKKQLLKYMYRYAKFFKQFINWEQKGNVKLLNASKLSPPTMYTVLDAVVYTWSQLYLHYIALTFTFVTDS